MKNSKLKDAIETIKTFGQDYNAMSEKQQYEMGSYVNLMSSTTQLLVNPIKGIQPKYTSDDLDQFIVCKDKKVDDKTCEKYRDLIISLANFLYKIDLNDRDMEI